MGIERKIYHQYMQLHMKIRNQINASELYHRLAHIIILLDFHISVNREPTVSTVTTDICSHLHFNGFTARLTVLDPEFEMLNFLY